MHRLIARPPSHLEVDHRNGDSLDNRRKNLRICTRSENQWNRLPSSRNRTGYKGVKRQTKSPRWMARITVRWREIYLGTFDTPEEAARAYDASARHFFGPFARLNNV
jgi:hypothetical protein